MIRAFLHLASGLKFESAIITSIGDVVDDCIQNETSLRFAVEFYLSQIQTDYLAGAVNWRCLQPKYPRVKCPLILHRH